jgi:tetratricopeptide (TPR) repeat protein
LTDRGWINLEHNRAFAGLADLNKAIGLMEYSASARARLYRASAFLMLKDLDKAVSDLDESQRIDPTSRLLYLTRGDVEFAQKHYDAALRDYDEFSGRAPDLGDGLVGRGLILEEIGHRAEALRAIESGLKLDPTNSDAVAARERLRSAGGR